MYRSGVLEATEAYNKLTTRQKYAKDEFYRKFKENVWEVNHEDAMGTLKDMLPQGNDVYSFFHEFFVDLHLQRKGTRTQIPILKLVE